MNDEVVAVRFKKDEPVLVRAEVIFQMNDTDVFVRIAPPRGHVIQTALASFDVVSRPEHGCGCEINGVEAAGDPGYREAKTCDLHDKIGALEDTLADAVKLLREVIESPFITDETVWQAWVLKWRPRADAVISEATQ